MGLNKEQYKRISIHLKEASYSTDLRDRFLRDHFVFGLNSSRVRKKCLKEGSKLTFNRTKKLAKSEESAERQMRIMSQGEVHIVHKHKQQGKPASNKFKAEKFAQQVFRKQSKESDTKQKVCMGCGNDSHLRSKCPAKDISFHYWHKKGHYAKVCMKKGKQINEVSSKSVGNSNDIANSLFLGPITATPISDSNINIVS